MTGTAAQAAPEGATLDVRTLRCAAFIDMASKGAGRFRVLVRWIDGWHAAGAGNALFTETDYEKQVDAATSACHLYPKRSLMKVMAGKFR